MNNTTGHAHDATAWLQLARRLQKQQLQQLSRTGGTGQPAQRAGAYAAV